MKIFFIPCLCLCFFGQTQANIFNTFFGFSLNCRPQCDSNATCRTGSQLYCVCNFGYTGNGTVCDDINECRRTPSPCRKNTRCVNLNGSYRCDCINSSYVRVNKKKCKDINECRRTPSPCRKNTRCVNLIGSYRCDCINSSYVRVNKKKCKAITTTTSPQPSPTISAGTNLCNGRNRVWTECRGIPPTRITIDSCQSSREVCNEGILLGELFRKNFFSHAAVSETGRIIVFGNSSGNSRSIRSTNNINFQPCNVESLKNAKGDVIAGKCKIAQNYFGSRLRIKRKAKMQTKRDLLLIFDESGSVGRNGYEKIKRVASAIVKSLCRQTKLHPNYTRVAIMSFNSQVHFHVDLISEESKQILDSDKEELADYIKYNISYQGGGATCLTSALDQAYNVALSSSRGGRRLDLNVEQDILIITDGCANCVSNPAAEIMRWTSIFMNNNIQVYVIGFGLSNLCKKSLSLIAQGGRCYHFFYLAKDKDLDDFSNQLENAQAGVCLDMFESPHVKMQCLQQP